MELAAPAGGGRLCIAPAPAPWDDEPDLARNESPPPPLVNKSGRLPTLAWPEDFIPAVDATAPPISVFFLDSLRARSVKCPCAVGPSHGGAPAAASIRGERYISCTHATDWGVIPPVEYQSTTKEEDEGNCTLTRTHARTEKNHSKCAAEWVRIASSVTSGVRGRENLKKKTPTFGVFFFVFFSRVFVVTWFFLIPPMVGRCPACLLPVSCP